MKKNGTSKRQFEIKQNNLNQQLVKTYQHETTFKATHLLDQNHSQSHNVTFSLRFLRLITIKVTVYGLSLTIISLYLNCCNCCTGKEVLKNFNL